MLKGVFGLFVFGGGGVWVFLATPRSLWDLNSPTRDRTQVHGSESAES